LDYVKLMPADYYNSEVSSRKQESSIIGRLKNTPVKKFRSRLILTVNVQINVNETGRMCTDLTLVLTLVTAVDALDLKAPVVRILKFHGVPRVAGVRLLPHRQQVHLLAVVLSSYPGHLRTNQWSTSYVCIREKT
jgi:hypothetical protein